MKFLFFLLIVRPLTYVLLGLNARHPQRLPHKGPAIIVANHNSHLDTLVLMSLLPIRQIEKVRPVAAADYFLRNRFLSWFATRIIGILPIKRHGHKGNPLAGCFKALRNGDILILFPEGSRGEPEKMADKFKQGIQLIARKFPEVPIHPVFLHGLGKALPKGEGLLVPMFCDVIVGEPMIYLSCPNNFLEKLHESLKTLTAEGEFSEWR